MSGTGALRPVRHPAEHRRMCHLRARLEVEPSATASEPRGHELDRLQSDRVVEGLVVVAREALDRVRGASIPVAAVTVAEARA
jgi:hypothetical protein